MSRRGRLRQKNRERAASSELTFDVDAAVLQFDDLFRQGKSQARATEVSGGARVELLKLDKQFTELVDADADTGIAYTYTQGPVFVPIDDDAHIAAVLRELHCVG